jgi:hypothetical protein
MLRHHLVTFILLFGIPQITEAHRQHIGWTSINWNDRANSLELVHRVHEHDAQLYLDRNTDEEASVTDLRGRAEFALYLSNHFRISVEPETAETVELIGAELIGQYLMVYQEFTLTGPPKALAVYSGILMDQFPDQVNMVNIDINGVKQTLQFNRSDDSSQLYSSIME